MNGMSMMLMNLGALPIPKGPTIERPHRKVGSWQPCSRCGELMRITNGIQEYCEDCRRQVAIEANRRHSALRREETKRKREKKCQHVLSDSKKNTIVSCKLCGGIA